MSALLLTDTELRELTGYAVRARQIEWLKANRVPFFVNGRGRAKVARAAIEGQPQAQEQPPTVERGWTPQVLAQG